MWLPFMHRAFLGVVGTRGLARQAVGGGVCIVTHRVRARVPVCVGHVGWGRAGMESCVGARGVRPCMPECCDKLFERTFI